MVRFMAMGPPARAAFLAGGALITGAVGYGIWSVNQSNAPMPVVSNDQPAPAAAPEATAPANTSVASDAQPEASVAEGSVAPISEAPADLAVEATPNLAEPDLPAATEPTTEAISEPAVELPSGPATAEATATISPEVQTVIPTFDIVRVEPDGEAVIAGRAEPGAKVILRLDGDAISATTADAQGNFVALLALDPSTVPRMLTMGSVLQDQSEVLASDAVALAPTPSAPVAAVIETPTAVVPDPVPDALAGSEVAALDTQADPVTGPEPQTEAPAALLVTNEGVNVLQSGQPAAPGDGNVALAMDTISYTPSGQVQLAGRAPAGTQVRVYLDNAPLIDIPVAENGLWASTLPVIEPGIYTLRVDALDADGAVTARFETPFKRETQAALAAAAQNEQQTAALAPDQASITPSASAAGSTDATSDPATSEPVAVATAADAAAPQPVAADADAGQTQTVASLRPAGPVSITVQPGFTLWGIASEQFGDGILYVQVFEANKDKIRDPDLIYPGQVFVIPKASE